jgi:hypothetical protein
MTRQTIPEVEAVEKTLRDCARCDVVSRCDAHVTGGSWHHLQGVSPCRPIIDSDQENARIISSGAYHPKAVQ